MDVDGWDTVDCPDVLGVEEVDGLLLGRPFCLCCP